MTRIVDFQRRIPVQDLTIHWLYIRKNTTVHPSVVLSCPDRGQTVLAVGGPARPEAVPGQSSASERFANRVDFLVDLPFAASAASA
jgi:hypothetical protein